MSDELKNNINRIMDCAMAAEKLEESLEKYLNAYSGISNIMDEFQQREIAATRNLKDFVPMLSEFTNTQAEATEKMGRVFDDFSTLSAELSSLMQLTKEETKKAVGEIKKAQKALAEQIKGIVELPEILHDIQNQLTMLPQLTESSKKIQFALGAFSDIGELESVSEKLALQSAQTNAEKEEILETLRDSVEFKKIVKDESEKVIKKINQKIDMHFDDMKDSTQRDTVETLLEEVLSLKQLILENTSFIGQTENEKRTASEDVGKDTTPSTSKGNTLQNLFNQCPKGGICIVEKQTWINDFVFVIVSMENGDAIGYYSKQGKFRNKGNLKDNDSIYNHYHGDYVDKIKEEHIKHQGKFIDYDGNEDLPL